MSTFPHLCICTKREGNGPPSATKDQPKLLQPSCACFHPMSSTQVFVGWGGGSLGTFSASSNYTLKKHVTLSDSILTKLDDTSAVNLKLPTSGKVLREKNFANLWFLLLFTKAFTVKFGGMVSFGVAQMSNPQKFSLQKSSFSPTRESFLPQKFPTTYIVDSGNLVFAILTPVLSVSTVLFLCKHRTFGHLTKRCVPGMHSLGLTRQ